MNLADESMRIRKKKMIPARFEGYTDYFAYLCRNQKNKTMEQAAFTREELMRRLEEHRRKKKELIETIQKEMHDRIKERTGEDVTSFNVW